MAIIRRKITNKGLTGASFNAKSGECLNHYRWYAGRKEMAQPSDKDLAAEAVKMAAGRFRDIKLSPVEFSAQNALIVLLEMIEEDPASDVAQWMVPVTKESVWRDDGSGGLLQESVEPLHVQFRQAWDNFRSDESLVM